MIKIPGGIIESCRNLVKICRDLIVIWCFQAQSGNLKQDLRSSRQSSARLDNDFAGVVIAPQILDKPRQILEIVQQIQDSPRAVQSSFSAGAGNFSLFQNGPPKILVATRLTDVDIQSIIRP